MKKKTKQIHHMSGHIGNICMEREDIFVLMIHHNEINILLRHIATYVIKISHFSISFPTIYIKCIYLTVLFFFFFCFKWQYCCFYHHHRYIFLKIFTFSIFNIYSLLLYWLYVVNTKENTQKKTFLIQIPWSIIC